MLESIPAEHRPPLNTTIAGQSITTLTGSGSMTSLGTTFFPVILTDAETGEQIRIVVYALVVPTLFMGMFIGRSAEFCREEWWEFGSVTFTFDFGQGGVRKVKGM